VACTSHLTPFLLVFGQNGDMIYNSCGGTDPTNPNDCPGTELLNANLTTPLIGTDNSVITADNHRIIRFYSVSSHPMTAYSSVSAMSGLSLGSPQGAIYTQAPGVATIGLITLLFSNGPAVTFNSGAIGDSGAAYGFIALDEIGSGTTCDKGTCFYSGNNSACAVTLYDTDDNVTGGRIYAVVNQTFAVNTAPDDTEQYYGRVYALTITTSGISETWYYDFVSNGIIGPSSASPMCSPNGHIFTDYGSELQDKDYCPVGDPPPAGTSCGAGVLGLIDCASPFSCSGSTTYLVVSGYPLAIASLPTDASGHTTGASRAGMFFNANFSYDFVNGCYWVHPNGLSTVSCLSTTSASVLEAINVAYLANGANANWNIIFSISNITVATSPTNSSDAAIIMGAQTINTETGSYRAVLAVDTGQCSSATCTTSWVSCPSGLSCSTSWSTSPALSWYFDLKAHDGGIAAGQFVVVTDTSDNACLVAFTDSLKGTWLLSAPGEAQGGCAE
jgi:hypothetical protein